MSDTHTLSPQSNSHHGSSCFCFFCIFLYSSNTSNFAGIPPGGAEDGGRWWLVGGWGWGGWQECQLHSNPEGSRYVEAVGKGEQVHGNSEIVAYACKPDRYRILWLEEKEILKRDGKQWLWRIGVEANCDLHNPDLGFTNTACLSL